jgi:hypothetical protein
MDTVKYQEIDRNNMDTDTDLDMDMNMDMTWHDMIMDMDMDTDMVTHEDMDMGLGHGHALRPLLTLHRRANCKIEEKFTENSSAPETAHWPHSDRR